MNERTLNELFGSAAKTRLIKLFLWNPETGFQLTEITTRTRLRRGEARRWLNRLVFFGLVKITANTHKKKRNLYRLNPDFELREELKALIAKAIPQDFGALTKGLKKVGGVKLAVVTGAFLRLDTSRIDMLIVCDNINLKRFNELVKGIEAELGREIRYVTMNRDEFLYRYRMFDRFLRDILELPHQKIINRLRIE